MSDIEYGADYTDAETAEAEIRQRVRNRLRLAKALIETRKPLAIPSDVGPGKDGSWIGEWHLHDSLTYYLLLTCFDLLGQRQDWLDFNAWISRKEKKAERKAVADAITETDPIKVTRAMSNAYNERYGVRNAFNNFIDNVLPPEAKAALLETIGIAQVSAEKQVEWGIANAPRPYSSEAEKLAQQESDRKKFLFQLRNDFTHAVLTFNTSTRNEAGDHLVVADERRPRVAFLQHVRGKPFGFEVSYFVQDWPFVLYEVVAAAINETVPVFDVSVSVAISGEWPGLIEVQGCSLADVRNPDRLEAIVKDAAEKQRAHK